MADNHQTAAVPNRPSLKPSSHFNNYPLWKAKLRENCYKRVREDRTRLLWKMRLPAAESLNHKDFIKSAFQDIVSDELKKFKDLPSNDSMKISSPVDKANDILWEYDGLHSSYQGECEEILLEMQRIFYEDLRTEPARRGDLWLLFYKSDDKPDYQKRRKPESNVETWEDQEDEYLARAVYEHMRLNEQAHEQTWCPICKQGELQENCQLIYCARCKLQLSKDGEVNLDTLRNRLSDVHAEHLDRGCRLKPKFRIETSFGLTALYIFCHGCSTFEVVI